MTQPHCRISHSPADAKLPGRRTPALVAVGAASCAGEDQLGSPAHRMSEWVSGTALGADIGTLNADNAHSRLDVPNGTGAVHAACGTIEVDADMANGELPSPDLRSPTGCRRPTAWRARRDGVLQRRGHQRGAVGQISAEHGQGSCPLRSDVDPDPVDHRQTGCHDDDDRQRNRRHLR